MMVDETLDTTCEKIELLDKLENFKRYSIALFFMAVFGFMVLCLSVGIIILFWRGQIDQSTELAKWLVGIVVALIGPIIGYYFGSNSKPATP